MALARSLLAVIAGIVTFTVLLLAAMTAGGKVFGTEPEWINRNTGMQLAWLAVNVVSMIVAGCVSAQIAPKAKTGHAVVMGALQTVLTLVALLTATNNATPMWLWIAGLVATVPAAWMGGRIPPAR